MRRTCLLILIASAAGCNGPGFQRTLEHVGGLTAAAVDSTWRSLPAAARRDPADNTHDVLHGADGLWGDWERANEPLNEQWVQWLSERPVGERLFTPDPPGRFAPRHTLYADPPSKRYHHLRPAAPVAR